MIRSIPQRVHLVGIGGIHMSGIAAILRHHGHMITGSNDQQSLLAERVRSLGVTVYYRHRAANIGDAEMLVYTSAAREDNPEIVEARRRGIPTMKRHDMVARLQDGRRVIAVSGTHGKTTTSSLIGYMLSRAGLDPMVLVGGVMRDFGSNALPGEGSHFVVEADEYDRAFLAYSPSIAVVTNIEPDHPDTYNSFEELTEAFAEFMGGVGSSGHIVACVDSPAVIECIKRSEGPHATAGPSLNRSISVVSYGITAHADWEAERIEGNRLGGSSFEAMLRGEFWGRVSTQLPGAHNVSNSLAAVAVGEIIGLSKAKIIESVREFQGVTRRFEFVGEAGGVTVMDDYAHHPTEVEALLDAARARFVGRRIVVLFQPHTYSRTKHLLDGFRNCFSKADALYIAQTYPAREDPGAGMDARALASEIADPKAVFAGSVLDAASVIAPALQQGDVFFTVGAGDVEKAAVAVLHALGGE